MANTLPELINPVSNLSLFKVRYFNSGSEFAQVNKYNCFTVLLVLDGNGTLTSDLIAYPVHTNSFISLSLYQPFSIQSGEVFKGMVISFHPEFFCLHKHRNEVSCNGVLFNNIYESPVMGLSATEAAPLKNIFEGMYTEMTRSGKPNPEVIISYLKILLIDASRLKVEKRDVLNAAASAKAPEILHQLKDTIEACFRSKHTPAEYAAMLNITPSALNRISKAHFNKTLSQLIADRLITESKRELYLTSKPVKQIAYELGFADEFYFSRYFKNHVGISPQYFRDTVGFDKANA